MPEPLALPNLFILGAAKAGTTALSNLLRQLPEIYFPFSKEPFFFNSDEHYAHGLEWYSRTFYPLADSYPYRCDATPHYLYWSEKTAPRIRSVYPTPPKMIVLLRDPVARAYSWYWNMVREGKEALGFEDALQAEEARLRMQGPELEKLGAMTYGYMRGSLYAARLKSFLEIFPRETFCFLLAEDLKKDPEGSMLHVFNFLDLAPRPLQPAESNPAALARSVRLQRWLRRKTTWRDRLKPLVPLRLRYLVKERIIQFNLRRVQYPAMTTETENALRARFDPDIRELEAMIGRDLSAWRRP